MTATKDIVLESILHEYELIKHLYEKLPEGQMDFKPRENMRSTLELLRYLSYIGPASVEFFLVGSDPTKTSEERFAVFRTYSSEFKEMKAEDFVKRLTEQRDRVHVMIKGFNEADLVKETLLPWGEKTTMIKALLNNTLKWLTAYRMQLFLYAKTTGADISTSNNWRGEDRKP